jgi:hypothetical protein
MATPELDELRWEQRRTMRMLPTSMIGSLPVPDLSGLRVPDLLAETALREEARAYARVLEGDMPRLRSHALGEAAMTVFDHVDVPDTAGLGETFEALAHRVRASRISDLSDLQAGEEIAHAFAWLAIVADVLAGDGYRDPRLPTYS